MNYRITALLLAAWLGAWLGLPSMVQGETARQAASGSSAAPSRRIKAREQPHQARQGGRRPWFPRRREGVAVQGAAATVWEIMAGEGPGEHGLPARTLRQLGLRPRGMGLKDLSHWPAEPRSPEGWDDDRFAAAFASLCPAGFGHEVAQYARFVLQVSREHGTDPALLAAIVYQQSECDAARVTSWGFGLTQLNRGLLPLELRDGRYPYFRPSDEGWQPAELSVRPTPLSRESLLDPYTNLRVAALQLRVLKQQCPAMDEPYGSKKHRHFVSHFIWGDEVRDAGAEDRVLETRRRLLSYYNGMRSTQYAKVRGVVLVSPMDGTPRIATSGLGDDRDDGKRRHAGIDYLSRFGEPVRAIADGRVVYAGTDLTNDRKVNVEPDRAGLVPQESMGARGLFVELDHAEGLHSVYAHLASYLVRAGDHVQRGQLLGYVGRTGIRESDPHLHFGLFADGKVLDPLVALEGLVFGPDMTRRPPQPHDHHEDGHVRRRKGRLGKGRRGRGGRRGLANGPQLRPTLSATIE